MAGLYIHIPFCKQACHYCDFHFSTQLSNKGNLIKALIKEIEIQKYYLKGEAIKTIYFGGGTPSILSEIEINSLLNSVWKNFAIDADAEVTLEANPDDLSMGSLLNYKAAGINRLSIGIQSFDDGVLRFLNRAHNCIKATESVELAREVGFSNISIDLIYSIPGQSLEDWLRNIRYALSLSPEHISAYSLTIEEKTVFGNWAKKGKLIAMAEDPSATQFEVLMETLADNGFEQYEISNFCKPGFVSKHNSSYWNQESYLGVGPSAHSFNGSLRQSNVRNNSFYIKSIESGIIPAEVEILTRENKINETILISIRTSQGLELQQLKTRYDYDVSALFKIKIDQMIGQELITVMNNRLILTKKGKLVADKIAYDLFVEDKIN
jgi:oxygen-independent coproporphyrinogen-3 oxidase